MDLKQELPKLGKETGGKVYYEVDGKPIPIGRRPDYAEFKNKPYQDEETCVSILLGISKPNTLLLSLVRQMNSLSMKDKENDPSYGLYRQLVNLFQSIRRTIDIGIETGDIGKISETKVNDMQAIFRLHSSAMSSEPDVEFAYSCLNCEFSCSRYFTALGFLNWMQENGYPIPEELAIEKNGNGKTIWAGHSRKTKQTTTIPVPPETKWHQIHFRIVNPTRIEITTPEGMTPYHPDDLGFTPNIWDLFERFASDIEYSRGNLDCRAGELNHSVAPEYIMAVKWDISRLRVLLKAVFPIIEGNPIIFEKTKGYRAEFHITEA